MVKWFYLTSLICLGFSVLADPLNWRSDDSYDDALLDVGTTAIEGREGRELRLVRENLLIKITPTAVVGEWIHYTDVFATYANPQWEGIQRWSIELPANTKVDQLLVHFDYDGPALNSKKQFVVVYYGKNIIFVIDPSTGADTSQMYRSVLSSRFRNGLAFDELCDSLVRPRKNVKIPKDT